MREMVFRNDEEFFIDEGCFITEMWNSEVDGDVSVAKARVKVGVTTRWHRLRGTVERYVILSGRGTVEVGESISQEVGPGDVVIIPAMCRQRITNLGQEDLVFLAICTPRFLPEVYEDVE